MKKLFIYICKLLDTTPAALRGKSRVRPLVMKRQVAAYYLIPYGTLREIGELLGYTDHSSVIYASKQAADVHEVAALRISIEDKINAWLAKDRKLRRVPVAWMQASDLHEYHTDHLDRVTFQKVCKTVSKRLKSEGWEKAIDSAAQEHGLQLIEPKALRRKTISL